MAIASRPRKEPVPGGRGGTAASSWLWLGLVLLVGIGLPVVSALLGLYDRVQHWGKLVHALDAMCATLLFGVLLFAWRDLERVDLADELAALMSMCAGVLFGVMWEIVEFVIDWMASADLQKSNSDTMTDLLWNDVGTAIAAVLAARLYCHWLGPRQRQEVGGLARWLVSGPSRLLDRHGFLMTLVAGVLIAAAVALVWFSGRPVPGLAIP
jgi:hypothetical protein